MMAGVLALATQLNDGQNIGPINPALYGTLARPGRPTGSPTWSAGTTR
jgi:hypothetical protein